MDAYEWTDSGLELLQRIAGFVLKNGGNTRCAQSIELEWKNPYQIQKAAKRNRQIHLWSRTETQFLQANLHLDYYDIALQMKDRTPDAVRQKIWRLKQTGDIGSKREAKRNFKQLNK